MSISRLILLIDKSESMKINGRLDQAKKLVEDMPSYNRVSVYGFDETCRLYENIHQLEPDGGTCIFKALEFIFGEMEKFLNRDERLSLVLITDAEDSPDSFREDFIQSCWTSLLNRQVDGECLLLGTGNGVAQILQRIFGCRVTKDSQLSGSLKNMTELHNTAHVVFTKFEGISDSLKKIKTSQEITENAINHVKKELEILSDDCQTIKESLKNVRQGFNTWEKNKGQFSIKLKADAIKTLEDYEKCKGIIDEKTKELSKMKHEARNLNDLLRQKQEKLMQKEENELKLRMKAIEQEKTTSEIEKEYDEMRKQIANALALPRSNSNKIKIMKDQARQIAKKLRDNRLTTSESWKRLKELYSKIILVKDTINDNCSYTNQTIIQLTDVLNELDGYAIQIAKLSV